MGVEGGGLRLLKFNISEAGTKKFPHACTMIIHRGQMYIVP